MKGRPQQGQKVKQTRKKKVTTKKPHQKMKQEKERTDKEQLEETKYTGNGEKNTSKQCTYTNSKKCKRKYEKRKHGTSTNIRNN